MAYLLSPDAEPQELYRPLSLVGTGGGCDLQLQEAVGVEAGHFQLRQEADGHRLIARANTRVNGSKVREILLEDGDRIDVGPHQITYRSEPLLTEAHGGVDPSDALLTFARRVQAGADPSELLEVLLELCADLAQADAGFVVLLEEGQANVICRLGKAIGRDEPVLLSDTLLSQVRGRRRPLLVADVLNDPRLASAQSVIDLKLRAAIGLPLMRGGELAGLIHLGSDRAVNRFEPATLKALEVLSAQAGILLELASELQGLERDRSILRNKLDAMRLGRLIGACPQMSAVFSRMSVLVLGETGTGKELVARELHDRSGRAKAAFVAINCGAIPAELLESELFGHKKGAFTGASRDRRARLLEADKGTLFLDEIGEMAPHLQVKLLRALQEGVINPVGSDKEVNVDLRVVAATNVNLAESIASGRFREDLFYRLAVIEIELPALRDRAQDILLLARAFLAEEEGAKPLGAAAERALLEHPWPGNVRELQNRIRRASLMADGDHLEPSHLGLELSALGPQSLQQATERFRAQFVARALAENDGDRRATAAQLDVDLRTISRHVSRQKMMQPEGQ